MQSAKETDYSIEKALEARRTAQRNNQSFVLTNGCFDIVHAGHACSLSEASTYGDILWVGLNSDISIKKIKGENRPIIPQLDRAYLLASLKSVSGVFIFSKENISNEIRLLHPDVYIKSDDYSLMTIDTNEKTALNDVGAEIRFVPMVKNLSTSNIIDKIKSQS